MLEKRVADSTTLLTLDVSSVASGVYFLSVENSESKVVKRVVKN
ncbi:MAG: T9SS type A sorting domain-containing protein [Bacteroidia bacterium]|nr:T9SS type A sorting domain-containing protein [Bacteroidia bacterium]